MSDRAKWTAAGAALLVVAMLALLWSAWTMGPSSPSSADAPIEASDESALLGRVLDPEGKPVADAEVIATQEAAAGGKSDGKADAGTVRVRTGSDGHFAFGALASGTWRIDAEAKGLLNPGPAPARQMPVEIDDTTAVEVDLQLRRAATVSGRVLKGREPVAGARIWAEVRFAESLGGQVSGFSVELGVSGGDGSFEGRVPPGRLIVRAEAKDAGKAKSEELVLGDGGGRDGLVLLLGAGGNSAVASLQGRVHGRDGRGLAALVEIYSDDGKPRSQQVGDDGEFRFGGLAPGRWRLRARATGFGVRELEVDLVGGEISQVDVLLGGGGGMTGKVVDSQGQPVAEATILLTRGDETSQMRTGADGTFRIDRPELLGNGATVQAVSLQHADSERVDAVGGAEVTLTLGPGGEIHGFVQDAEGKPLPGSVVSVHGWAPIVPDPFSPQFVRPDRVVNEGAAFAVGPLRPGRYRLRGEAPGRGAVLVDDLVVTSGNVRDNVVIRLGVGGVVRGQVRDEQGQAVPDAKIIVWEPGAVLPPKSGRSDAEGRYIVRGVTPGRLSVRAQHPEYLTAMESGVEVREAEETERDIVVRKRAEGERFSFQGIGATLGEQNGAIVVRNLIDGAPAGAAGLQNGDRIVGVDGSTTLGMALSTVVERIRGEPGSSVMLDIDRPGRGRITVTIQRGQVVVK